MIHYFFLSEICPNFPLFSVVPSPPVPDFSSINCECFDEVVGPVSLIISVVNLNQRNFLFYKDLLLFLIEFEQSFNGKPLGIDCEILEEVEAMALLTQSDDLKSFVVSTKFPDLASLLFVKDTS